MNEMKRFFVYQFLILFLIALDSCKTDIYDIEMVHVTGGSFQMGSDAIEADIDEQPIHTVNVKDFYLSKYEVTQGLWKAVMGHNPSYHKGFHRPVENVSWDDCQKFIEKLNRITGLSYRLPTEEEWEYAACASADNIREQNIASFAWCIDSFGSQKRRASTQNVGMLEPNSLGIYDLIGNVNEWCSNSYDSLSYKNGFSRESEEKVFRGGCFANEMKFLRPANRNHINRYTRHYTLGFRLAMDETIQTTSLRNLTD